MSVAPCAAEAAAREIATLEEYFAANVASRLDREPPPGDRALAAAFARAGLLGPARRALEHSLDEIPDGDPGRAALLSDLGLVLALGARSRDDLDRARARLDAALAALPRRAHRESGDVLARLALVHRRRGDLELERASLREAAALDPAAAARYLAPGESPVGAGGTSNEE
jgi:tetratricopeptide (TPR) repeat protein